MEYKRIDEICVVQNGYTPSKKVKEHWENGTIPWFRMEDIRQNGRVLDDAIQHITPLGVKGNVFPANSLIFATSATVGEHALIKIPFICNQRFTCIHLKDAYLHKIDIKYLFYYSYKIDDICKSIAQGGGTFPSINLDKFKSFQIPVPPIEIQREIVSILDRFDSLCNDLTSGLPAEIEARQKQYEYYRDKLLTFEPLTK